MARKKNLSQRTKILDAAFELFYRQGYRGVSMDEIAARAKIKKANLFHYFPSKEALALAVFADVEQYMRENVLNNFADNGDTPVQKIEKMFERSTQRMKDNRCCKGCFFGNWAQELSDHNEKMRSQVAEYFKFWIAEVTKIFEEGKRSGYFKKSFEPRESAESVLALLEGGYLFCKAKKDVQTMKSASKMAVNYLEGFRS